MRSAIAATLESGAFPEDLETPAGADLDARARAFVRAWHARMGRAWHPESVIRLHPVLEDLVADAEHERRADLAEPAFALTVYLCTFVDGGAIPAPRQSDAMERLLDALGRAAGLTGGFPAADPTAATTMAPGDPAPRDRLGEAAIAANCR